MSTHRVWLSCKWLKLHAWEFLASFEYASAKISLTDFFQRMDSIAHQMRINRIPFRSMKVFRHNSRTELRPAEIHLLLRNFKYLESLDVSHNIELTSDSLSMLRKLVRLENLNLSNCKSVDHRVTKFISCLTNLTRLEFAYLKIQGGIYDLEQLTQLRYLDLYGTGSNDETLGFIANRFRLLTYLDISDTDVTKDGAANALQKLPELQAYISRVSAFRYHQPLFCIADTDTYCAIANLSNLTKLVVEEMPRSVPSELSTGLAILGKSGSLPQTLKVLEIRALPTNTHPLAFDVAQLEHIKNLKSLQRLKIDLQFSVMTPGNANMPKILASLPNLTSLDLTCMPFPFPFDKMVPHLKQLRSLRLVGCQLSHAFDHITRLNKLESLSIDGCAKKEDLRNIKQWFRELLKQRQERQKTGGAASTANTSSPFKSVSSAKSSGTQTAEEAKNERVNKNMAMRSGKGRKR